jgi:hypothetical protein
MKISDQRQMRQHTLKLSYIELQATLSIIRAIRMMSNADANPEVEANQLGLSIFKQVVDLLKTIKTTPAEELDFRKSTDRMKVDADKVMAAMMSDKSKQQHSDDVVN